MTAAARQRSTAVAELSADRVGQTVIEGSIATLDRFSHYAPPDLAKERRASRDGFGGIGVTLDIHESDVRIAGVMPDTPAASAGRKSQWHVRCGFREPGCRQLVTFVKLPASTWYWISTPIICGAGSSAP